MKATNQKRGATIRIIASATAKWIRQCTRSGRAQPFFWSLPCAIQAFCKRKSAMTCLRVKSSIQPINRPTGTDDDMDGNDKLTLAETWTARGLEALSALSFQTLPLLPVMNLYA